MAKLDQQSLLAMISSDEDEQLEFKRGLLAAKEITEYAVALGNEGGGWLIMGVTNRRPRVIADLAERSRDELLKIQSAVLDSAGIRIRLHQVKMSDGWVLAAEIPSRLPGKVFYTRTGKYLMRAGESLRAMTNEEIAAIFAEASSERTLSPYLALINDLRRLAVDKKVVRLHPIVPRSREGDEFQVEAVTQKSLSLHKLSSGHYIEIPTSRLVELLYSGSSTPPTVVINGRLQWISVNASWHFFPEAPTTEHERYFGFEKMSSLNDPRVRALQQQLEPRGIRFHFSHERDVSTLEAKGWEIMFDSDGRYFRIVNGNESLVLVVLRSSH